MKIAICDDDEMCRAQIIKFTDAYASKHENRNISYTVFSHAEELLDVAQKIGGFDVYLLDIVMPDINGIELGFQLRKSGYDGKIIYLTSSEEFAIDSFKVKAFNYILKPIEIKSLFSALDEAFESISTKAEKSIIVKTKENSVRLSFDRIMYAQLSRRAITYYLTNGKTIESVQIRAPFSEIVKELLEDSRFILCGTNMTVNLHHITMVENDLLIFKDTYKVYPSKKSCREIRSAWSDFWFDGEESK